MLKIEIGEKNTYLRTKSEKIYVHELSQYVKLGKKMIKYIKNPTNGGIGLAAPQVGYNKRIIVVSLLKNWEDKTFKTIMMINPQILEHSSHTNTDQEGCLSLPGKKGNVTRWNSIKLQYFDEKHKKHIMIYEGVSARIIQHEIDHLDGVLFIDKLQK